MSGMCGFIALRDILIKYELHRIEFISACCLEFLMLETHLASTWGEFRLQTKNIDAFQRNLLKFPFIHCVPFKQTQNSFFSRTILLFFSR